MQVRNYVHLLLCTCACLHVCMYAHMQIFPFLCMQVCNYAIIQAGKYVTMQLCKNVSRQVCKISSTEVCKFANKYASIQLGKSLFPIWDLLFETLYKLVLKPSISCKKLSPFATIVRLAIFLLYVPPKTPLSTPNVPITSAMNF